MRKVFYFTYLYVENFPSENALKTISVTIILEQNRPFVHIRHALFRLF